MDVLRARITSPPPSIADATLEAHENKRGLAGLSVLRQWVVMESVTPRALGGVVGSSLARR